MKKLLFIALIFSSIVSYAQYPILEVKDTISIWFKPDTISGIPLLREARYRLLYDNRETKEVSISGKIYYYNQDKVLFPVIPPTDFELKATTSNYVLMGDSGRFIGDIDKVRELYGSYDSLTNLWTYSRQDITSEYEFYLHISNQPVSVRSQIIAALQKSSYLKK